MTFGLHTSRARKLTSYNGIIGRPVQSGQCKLTLLHSPSPEGPFAHKYSRALFFHFISNEMEEMIDKKKEKKYKLKHQSGIKLYRVKDFIGPH